jgi:hypothetical protein
MKWLGWALLLVLQNAAFTWVSRARNSGSLWYHGIAAIFSNGIWFASQLILIVSVKDLRGIGPAASVAALYVVSTATGSVLMHWFSMKYLEKGKRAVGSH